MNRISTSTLGRVIVIGGLMIPVTGYGTRWLIQEKIKQSASYCEVIEIIKNNEKVKKMFGEPFKIGRIDVGDNESCGQIENKKWFSLPITGPQGVGNLTYWVTITDPTINEFHVSKIEIIAHERDKPKIKWSLLLKDIENNVENKK